MENFVWQVVGSVVRHGLTALAMYLAARGLPEVDDATITGLSAFVVGGISVGWSVLKEWRRRPAS